MATHFNTGSPDRQVPRGFFSKNISRVVDAIREVIFPPSIRVQDTKGNPDRFMPNNQSRNVQINLTNVTSGRHNLLSRTQVPDEKILEFLGALSRTAGR